MTDLTPRQIHQSLLDRLAEFRARVRGRLVFEGVVRLLTAAVLLALLSFALDRLFRLSVGARWAMLGAAGVTLAAVAWRHVVQPLRLKLDPMTLAGAVDRMTGAEGFLTARVATVLELPALLGTAGGPSVALLQRAATDCHRALASVDFDARLDDRRQFWAGAVAVAALVLPLFLATAAPATAKLWAARVLGGSDQPWPQKTYLQINGVENGAIVVPRGEPFVLRVNARPGSVVPDVVAVHYRETGAARVDANLTAYGPNDFRYEFPSVNTDTRLEIAGGDDTAGPVTLRPADRPKVVDLKLTAQHPTEPASTVYSFGGTDTDLSFLARTKLSLSFTANTPIAEAHLKTSGPAGPTDADVVRVSDRAFSVSWVQAAAVQMQIDLVSADARLASVPTMVGVGLKVDQPPRVTIGFSAVKTRVTARAKIPLTIDARDDYGLAAVKLTVKNETPDPANPTGLKPATTDVPLFGPVDPAVEKQVSPKQLLELEPLKLPVGSLVTVSAAATDGCYLGPQTTSSRPLTFRVVAPEELFREILLRQQAERAKFRKQMEEARLIRTQMNDLSAAGAATSLGRRHRAMQREVARIQTSLAESLVEMRANALGTDEAYDLMRKNVLSPLAALNDELLNPQRDAVDGIKTDDPRSVADVRDRQDQIVTRMGEVLHSMSQWDSFVDVLNQLNEVIKLQDAARQKTVELKKKQAEDVFK